MLHTHWHIPHPHLHTTLSDAHSAFIHMLSYCALTHYALTHYALTHYALTYYALTPSANTYYQCQYTQRDCEV